MTEKTSYKIMKTSEFLDVPEPAIYYKANCGCHDPDCGLTLALEYDSEIDYVTLSLYDKIAYCSYWNIKIDSKLYFLKDMYYRIKGALKILFTGKIELEEAFLFSDKEQVEAFITALREGTEKLQK